MTAPTTYTSVIRLLRDWLRVDMDHLLMRPESTGLPPRNLATSLPLSTAVQVGGTDNDLVIDLATISIDTYAADVDTAEDIAAQIRLGLKFRLPGYMLPDRSAWVKDVRVVSSPKQLPYDNSAIGRVGAVYQIGVRTKL